MNYSVHAIMYFYFGLTQCGPAGKRFAKRFAMLITCLQLTQMVIGIAVTVASVVYHSQVVHHAHAAPIRVRSMVGRPRWPMVTDAVCRVRRAGRDMPHVTLQLGAGPRDVRIVLRTLPRALPLALRLQQEAAQGMPAARPAGAYESCGPHLEGTTRIRQPRRPGARDEAQDTLQVAQAGLRGARYSRAAPLRGGGTRTGGGAYSVIRVVERRAGWTALWDARA